MTFLYLLCCFENGVHVKENEFLLSYPHSFTAVGERRQIILALLNLKVSSLLKEDYVKITAID